MTYWYERSQKKLEGIPSFDFFEDYIREENIGIIDNKIFWRFRFPNGRGANMELKRGMFRIIELEYPLGCVSGKPVYTDDGYPEEWLYTELKSAMARLRSIYIKEKFKSKIIKDAIL